MDVYVSIVIPEADSDFFAMMARTNIPKTIGESLLSRSGKLEKTQLMKNMTKLAFAGPTSSDAAATPSASLVMFFCEN